MRTPDFLRVVIDADGTIDALDQFNDMPKPTERICVYRINHAKEFLGFACGRDGCTPLIDAVYDYVLDQPEDHEIRETAAWCAWTQAKAESEVKR